MNFVQQMLRQQHGSHALLEPTDAKWPASRPPAPQMDSENIWGQNVPYYWSPEPTINSKSRGPQPAGPPFGSQKGANSRNSLIKGLEQNCDYGRYGCEAGVSLEEKADHMKRCHFHPEIRVKCIKGCEALVTRAALEQHSCARYLKGIIAEKEDAIEEKESHVLKVKRMNEDLHAVVESYEDEIETMLKDKQRMEEVIASQAKASQQLEEEKRALESSDRHQPSTAESLDSDENSRLWVGNIPVNSNEVQLEDFFSHFGPVQRVLINKRGAAQFGSNWATVFFKNPESVDNVFAHQPIHYGGVHLKINKSRSLKVGGRSREAEECLYLASLNEKNQRLIDDLQAEKQQLEKCNEMLEERLMSKDKQVNSLLAAVANGPNEGSNLFVGDLPADITEERLRKFFGQFGDILNIRLKWANNMRSRKCHILYKEYDSIDTVLSRMPITLNGKYLTVCPTSSDGYLITNVPQRSQAPDHRPIPLPPKNVVTNRLFVGNLSPETTRSELKAAFSLFGTFGFISFDKTETVDMILDLKEEIRVCDRVVVLNRAKGK